MVKAESQKGVAPLPPRIVEYHDHRIYLQDYYNFKKSQRPGFSFRQFCAMAGFKSPNYLQLVINGDRKLSNEAAQSVAVALRLSKAESEYFQALVKAANSSSESEKAEAESWKLASIKRLLTKEIPTARKEILSKWYHLLVREMTFLKDFVPDGEFISEKLNGLISPEQAEISLGLLQKAGFLEVKNGRMIAADPVLDTGDINFTHLFMQEHHAETLKTWSQNLPKLSPRDQELGVINIPINSEKIPELRRRIRQFQDEIIGFVQDETAADRVVQLGTYLIPFSGE